MVSPGPTFIEAKKIKRFHPHRLAHQPVDLREGVAKAYNVVKEVSAKVVFLNQTEELFSRTANKILVLV